MNDAEGAFLVYQWISKYIKIKCKGTEEDNSSVSVYNSGEGDVYGIASLFKTMVSYFHISSGIIEGYTRIYDNNTFIATKPVKWVWNYIIINDTYYLVDASYGIGGCLGDGNRFLDNMFFFGTKPEIFINWDFPYDNKWQLLSEPVSFDKFKNNVHLEYYFHQFGYYSISPENYTLEGGKEEITITLYYNEIFPSCKRTAQYAFYNSITFYGTSMKEFTKISDGILEANISTTNTKFNQLTVFAKETCQYEDSVTIANYFINHTKINN
jgi:transglutaminase/protease-like cytokinesis protein 3